MEAGVKHSTELDDDGVGDKALKASSVGFQIHAPLLKTTKQVFTTKN